MFKKLVIASILSIFVWQGVADAASISTRVRILESKVSKQDKKIKATYEAQKASSAKVDKGLAKMTALEKKLTNLIKESKQSKSDNKTDTRYSFP
jgi:uncharacterized coiled-coil protein SlyX